MNDRDGDNNDHDRRNPRSSRSNRGRNYHQRSRSNGERYFQQNGNRNLECNNDSAEHARKHQKPSPLPRKPPAPRQHENHVKNRGQAHGKRKNGYRQHEVPRLEHRTRPKAAAAKDPIQIPPALLDTASVSSISEILQWQTIHPHVPIASEERILNILMRWKERERGMMRNAGNRYQEVARACRQVDMQLPQALSLRRQHIQHLNPRHRMPALGLGNDGDIRKSAALFESAVEAYLCQCKLSFLTETQQKALLPKGVKHPPSPDFMLQQPTLLTTCTPMQYGQETIAENYVIHWIEVKMYYGASTLAVNSKCAVGCILPKAEKYLSLYGTGAMVFMYGCGKELSDMLLEIGVVALDAHMLDLQNVEAHQRTWCANKSGMILP